ncbi:IS4 family transposase, partial [Nocardiopsis oceani]
AFPKARVLTLNEVGTHAAIGAAIGPWSAGERTLAADLARLTDEHMLVLADAGFYSFELFDSFAQRGATLAWRVGASVELPPITPLADGSYTSLLFAPRVRRKTKDTLIAAARAGAHIDPSRARLVRAVDYTIPDANPEGELITVVTNELDSRELSAVGIAQAYGQRWEHETALGEIKRYLRGAGVVLSSQSPPMVQAQIWGLLLAHYAVRALMCEAADDLETDPDRMSFTHALQVVRPASQGGAVFSP